MADGTAPPSKRRAIEGTDAVQPSQTQGPARGSSKPPSHTAHKSTDPTKKPSGAAPGQPDTDEAFLKAVASTKRGKRAEDTFDREFNNLRISRPELEAAPERDAWAVLDDFGDDRDVRGNFMLIVELDVPERPRGPALRRGDEERADWAGRPDFKKFKKVGWRRLLGWCIRRAYLGPQKSAPHRRPVVELYAEDDEYDISSRRSADSFGCNSISFVCRTVEDLADALAAGLPVSVPVAISTTRGPGFEVDSESANEDADADADAEEPERQGQGERHPRRRFRRRRGSAVAACPRHQISEEGIQSSRLHAALREDAEVAATLHSRFGRRGGDRRVGNAERRARCDRRGGRLR